ncbi:macrolide transporter subunit MacA [compost metagenome]
MNRGTPLSVSVITQRKEKAITIPLAALRSYSGRNYVQVVDEQGNKKEVDVEIGQQTATDVEIIKGLTSGQKVVGR